jgi:hypothetical protein
MSSKNTLFIIFILLIAIALGSFYFYTNSVKNASLPTITQLSTQTPAPTTLPEVGTSTESSTIKKELDETELDSMDSDFNQLDTSASQL